MNYDQIIEEWWRHLGTYDRGIITGMACNDISDFLCKTDEWWESLLATEKENIYNDFFDEA